MKEQEIKKLSKDWQSAKEREIIDSLVAKHEEILSLTKEIVSETKSLERLAEKEENHALLATIADITCVKETVEEEARYVIEELSGVHAPEACNLLTVLEEKVGDLR
jgi:hypothetical protein